MSARISCHEVVHRANWVWILAAECAGRTRSTMIHGHTHPNAVFSSGCETRSFSVFNDVVCLFSWHVAHRLPFGELQVSTESLPCV